MLHPVSNEVSRMGVYYTLAVVFNIAVLSAHAQTQYGAGDTQIIDYSSEFCESLEATYNVRDSNISPSTLYILSEPSTLSDSNSFQFSQTANVSDDKVVLFDYHFYQGSVIFLTICRDEGNYTRPKYFYLLKGKHILADLKTHKDTLAVSVTSLNVTTLCADGYHMLNYTINTEEQYYLLLSGYDRDNVILSTNMTFNRSKYETPANNSASIIGSCTIDLFGDSCTVGVPLSKNYALLTYGTSSESPEEWDKDVRIDITCNTRVWLWVAIFVPIILFLILCVLVVLISICLLRKYRQHKGFSSEMAPLIRHRYEKPSNVAEYTQPSIATRKTLSYDKLTEMAITADDASNPHIIAENPNPPPSFTDHPSSPRFGSPTFTTFKPDNK